MVERLQVRPFPVISDQNWIIHNPEARLTESGKDVNRCLSEISKVSFILDTFHDFSALFSPVPTTR
jgi:hypothetical protein